MSKHTTNQEVDLHYEYNAEQQDSPITDSTLVIGADIAKKIHVARVSDVRGVELGKPLTFHNSRHGFEKLLTWIGSLMSDHSCDNVIFGVEPTGHYWMVRHASH